MPAHGKSVMEPPGFRWKIRKLPRVFPPSRGAERRKQHAPHLAHRSAAFLSSAPSAPPGTAASGERKSSKSRGEVRCTDYCGFTPVAEASRALALRPGSLLGLAVLLRLSNGLVVQSLAMLRRSFQEESAQPFSTNCRFFISLLLWFCSRVGWPGGKGSMTGEDYCRWG